MKSTKLITALLVLMAFFTACKKEKIDEIPESPKPTLENLELGLGNAGIGVIGEDFHFEGDILAVDKIDRVEVRMMQKAGETYSKTWKHEITWTQYKGKKNSNIHKHFNIPEDAAEGKYDLVVNVYDENGSMLEVKRDFEIFTRANLPVRPMMTGLHMQKNWMRFYDAHAHGDKYPTEQVKKGDTIQAQVNISFVKGDGKLYVLLVKKSSGYSPKTIEEIDLNKAVVLDVFEHKNEEKIYDFGNFIFDEQTFTIVRDIPNLRIGAEKDNNAAQPNAITGAKAWETGEYNMVVIYKNTTYNKTIYKTIPFQINYN